MDMNQMAKEGGEDVYGTFNLLMRRKPKENNFKAVLESIRDLVGEDAAVPPWLHDVLLGYGDPGAAGYRNQEGTLRTVDFLDTFLDAGAARRFRTFFRLAGPRVRGSTWGSAGREGPKPPAVRMQWFTCSAADHVREAFPDYDINFVNNSRSGQLQRPFRVTFPPFKAEEELAAKVCSENGVVCCLGRCEHLKGLGALQWELGSIRRRPCAALLVPCMPSQPVPPSLRAAGQAQGRRAGRCCRRRRPRAAAHAHRGIVHAARPRALPSGRAAPEQRALHTGANERHPVGCAARAHYGRRPAG